MTVKKRTVKKRFKMKKIALMLLICSILVYGCQKVTESAADESQEKLQAGEGLTVDYKSLSDIQVTACNTAHEAGTCETRLAELGIVLKEDCCEVLGKCC